MDWASSFLFSSLFLDTDDLSELDPGTGKEVIFAASAIDSHHALFSPQFLIGKTQGTVLTLSHKGICMWWRRSTKYSYLLVQLVKRKELFTIPWKKNSECKG